MAFKAVKALLSITALITVIASHTDTSATFAFSGKQPDGNSPKAGVFAESVSDILDKTDFRDNDSLKDMSNVIVEVADEYAAEENIGDFQKVSVVRVVDGDTIVIDIEGDACGNKDHEYSVRLIGVNTPESVASEEYLAKKGTTNSAEGKAASEFTKSLLQNYDYVYLEKDTSEEDKYGRLLRYVWLEIPTDDIDLAQISTEMLNGVLLSEGRAEVAIYEPDDKYEEEFRLIAESIDNDDYEYDYE